MDASKEAWEYSSLIVVGKNLNREPISAINMKQRLSSLFISLILLTSLAPVAAATAPSDSVIFGFSYDWENFENDVLDMTGVDTNEANQDLEEAADFAGFDLDLDQVLSGATHLYIESWDDSETVLIEDSNGISHEVSKRVTELTVRHGILADAGFTSSWIDENEAIDIWYSASQEMVLIIDATYTEYVDSDMLVYGADLEMSGEIGNNADLSFNVQVIAAGEVESPEVDLGYSISMEIPSLSSEWRANHPMNYLQQLNQEMNFDENELEIFICDNGEEIPSSWVNDGYEDCYDGSDETMVWSCRANVNLMTLPNLQRSSFVESFSESTDPDWCGSLVPNELGLDESPSNLPNSDDLYGWYDEGLGGAMARNDTHIWEHGLNENQCSDYGGDSWHENLEMCGWFLDGNSSSDSSMIYEDCCGFSKYELVGDYLYIASPITIVNYGGNFTTNGNIQGEFNTLTGYTMSAQINGISTEDLGLNLDTFNVQLSDSIPGQGTFYDSFEDLDGQMSSWDWNCPPVASGTEELVIDGTNVQVQCGLASPISPGMAVMMASSLEPAFDNGIRELSSVIQSQFESWLSEISGDEGNDIFICDNGEEIPSYWENDGEEDCSDGSDESGGSFTCENGETIPAGWENDGEQDCSDGSDENDSSGGSESSGKIESMYNALMESNLEKTMTAFSEKLDQLVSDNIPTEPIINLDDSCALLFWTVDDSRVVGFAIFNSNENLLGSTVYGVKDHDIDLNVDYFDGEDARNSKNSILGVNDLREIAPESRHDISGLYEILGPDYIPDLDQTDTDKDGIIDYFDQDDDDDGIPDWEDDELNSNTSIPGISSLAVISLLGLVAILSSRKKID